MEDLWSRINRSIPQYFESISKKYNLNFMRLSDVKTAIFGNKFAIIICIGRFNVDILYAQNIDGERVVFQCGSFLAEKYTFEDRQNLLREESVEDILCNNLKVIANGLESKWSSLLSGNEAWIADYKNSKWYTKINLLQEEDKILWELI